MKYYLRALLYYLPFSFILAITPPLNGEFGIVKAIPSSEERDLFKTLEEDNKQDSGLPTNPMELMRLLEKHSSMKDATTPSDALDQALEIFDEQSEENYPINN